MMNISTPDKKSKIIIDLRSKPKTGIYRYALRLMEGRNTVFEPFRDLGCGEADMTTRTKAILRMLHELFILPFILERRKAALFHCTKNFGLPLFSFGVKRVLTLMDVIPLKFSDYSPNVFFKLFYYWNFFLSCAVADKIICISRFTSNELIKIFPFTRKKIEVVYLGADPVHFMDMDLEKTEIPGIELNRKYILTIGGTEPRKNTGIVMDLFTSGAFPDHDLVVIGGEWKNIGFTEKQRNDPRIHLAGRVSEEELAALYRHADAFVFPSIYEGFGLPPLEAMACGIPVIAARASCLPEILEEDAEWFDPSDPQDLKRAIEKVMNDPEYREDLVKRGFQRIKRYPWEKTVDETLKIYQSLLDDSIRTSC